MSAHRTVKRHTESEQSTTKNHIFRCNYVIPNLMTLDCGSLKTNLYPINSLAIMQNSQNYHHQT